MFAKQFIKKCIKKSINNCKLSSIKNKNKLTNNWIVFDKNSNIKGIQKATNNYYCINCCCVIIKYGKDNIIKTFGSDI
jgi:hypothetical protein